MVFTTVEVFRGQGGLDVLLIVPKAAFPVLPSEPVAHPVPAVLSFQKVEQLLSLDLTNEYSYPVAWNGSRTWLVCPKPNCTPAHAKRKMIDVSFFMKDPLKELLESAE
jgi:hypothetical protein